MATDDLSREIILDHYQNPRNHGRLEHPTLANRGHNPLCGDEIELSVGIDEQDDRISEISFTGRGCSISKGNQVLRYDRPTNEHNSRAPADRGGGSPGAEICLRPRDRYQYSRPGP